MTWYYEIISSIPILEFWEIVMVSVAFIIAVILIILTQTRVVPNYIWPLILMCAGKLKSHEQIVKESKQKIPDFSKEVKLD